MDVLFFLLKKIGINIMLSFSNSLIANGSKSLHWENIHRTKWWGESHSHLKLKLNRNHSNYFLHTFWINSKRKFSIKIKCQWFRFSTFLISSKHNYADPNLNKVVANIVYTLTSPKIYSSKVFYLFIQGLYYYTTNSNPCTINTNIGWINKKRWMNKCSTCWTALLK